MYSNIQEIKDKNEAIGNHWFSPDTMRFFNSKVCSEVIKGRYFITSERMNTSTEPLRYTVREALECGRISTVSEFQEFKTLAAAKDYVALRLD